jgi:hypothetical protein
LFCTQLPLGLAVQLTRKVQIHPLLAAAQLLRLLVGVEVTAEQVVRVAVKAVLAHPDKAIMAVLTPLRALTITLVAVAVVEVQVLLVETVLLAILMTLRLVALEAQGRLHQLLGHQLLMRAAVVGAVTMAQRAARVAAVQQEERREQLTPEVVGEDHLLYRMAGLRRVVQAYLLLEFQHLNTQVW